MMSTNGVSAGRRHVTCCWRVSIPLVLFLVCVSCKVTTADPDPTPVLEPLLNLTVIAGREAKFTCRIKHLGTYKVAWIYLERSAILTMQNHVITRNPRISISNDQHRSFTLHISNVQESDKGGYMCQLNTANTNSVVGHLNVVVPPNIDDALSSSDITVREGSSVVLSCHATGSPPLSVRWRREDGRAININRTLIVPEWESRTLELPRVSRLDMGSVLCIASNGVPPAVSKRIALSVEFAPVVWVPHQLVGAPLGSSVTLECFLESYPAALHYWSKSDGTVLHDPAKYKVESISGTTGPGFIPTAGQVNPVQTWSPAAVVSSAAAPSYKTHLRLTVLQVSTKDYGSYKCLAKNPFGEADGVIKLYPTGSGTSSSPTGPLPTLGSGNRGGEALFSQTRTPQFSATGSGRNFAAENVIPEEFAKGEMNNLNRNRTKSDWTFSWLPKGANSSGDVDCVRKTRFLAATMLSIFVLVVA